MEDIISVKNEAIAQITEAKNAEELESLRIAYLGRNGKITELIKKIKDLSPEEKKESGRTINEAKNTIDRLLSDKKQELIKSLTEKENGST